MPRASKTTPAPKSRTEGNTSDIGGSQLREDLRMVDPATEVDGIPDSKGCHKLLQAIPFRAIAKHGEAGQTASQQRGSRSQRQITGLHGDQAPNEDQLKFRIRLRTALVFGAQGTARYRAPGTKKSLSR